MKGKFLYEIIFKNDIIKNLNTEVNSKKIKISFGNKIGLGYDGCGTHTHGFGIQSVIKKTK